MVSSSGAGFWTTPCRDLAAKLAGTFAADSLVYQYYFGEWLGNPSRTCNIQRDFRLIFARTLLVAWAPLFDLLQCPAFWFSTASLGGADQTSCSTKNVSVQSLMGVFRKNKERPSSTLCFNGIFCITIEAAVGLHHWSLPKDGLTNWASLFLKFYSLCIYQNNYLHVESFYWDRITKPSLRIAKFRKTKK